MSFIEPSDIEQLKSKLTTDASLLGKLYKSKKNEYHVKSVDHNLAEALIEEGWESVGVPSKTKTKIRKIKSHNAQFEDAIWCQLYELGYRHLNTGDDFRLYYGKSPLDRKQIDVIAINDDSILLIECKSSQSAVKAPSFKTEFEGLQNKISGFCKTLEQMFGKGRRVKYIFATRNFRFDDESADIQRLESTGSFFYNDNTYEYINSLIKSYKTAAHYQFMSLLFKGQLISREKIEVPALEGFMGNKKYYMFSIEPHTLLKIGFVLHRTRANKAEMPTYQRLLVPQRLKGISKFIDEGGFFPNSIILNFNKNEPLQFESSGKAESSKAKLGTLKIPNAYAIAYIIDGQHRIYGYAQSKYKENNTVPVVAFYGLDSTDQLKIFMDINENQKAVSPTLRITLEKDLYWNSDRADSRMKALRSSIIEELNSSLNGPFYNKISIGEDKSSLSSKFFAEALSDSGLLPKAKGNQYDAISSSTCLYNIKNLNHLQEMQRAEKSVFKFINHCYEYIQDNYPEQFNKERYFISSNRGIYALICLIGSLNTYETNLNNLSVSTKPDERFKILQKYIDCLIKHLISLSPEEESKLLDKLGAGADIYWLRYFQSIVNANFSGFAPSELIDWKERQDSELQDQGRKYATQIEKILKERVISNLKTLFGEDWELEINSIKRECIDRAEKEKEKRYKEGLGRHEIPWTDMFFISDYKTIIEKFWTKLPEIESDGFENFETLFSIDIGHGFNSKSEKIKWLSIFSTIRNNIAHEGTKEKGINNDEVKTLEGIYKQLTRN